MLTRRVSFHLSLFDLPHITSIDHNLSHVYRKEEQAPDSSAMTNEGVGADHDNDDDGEIFSCLTKSKLMLFTIPQPAYAAQ